MEIYKIGKLHKWNIDRSKIKEKKLKINKCKIIQIKVFFIIIIKY